MNWWWTNTIGRTLARFSNDIGTVDQRIPTNFLVFVYASIQVRKKNTVLDKDFVVVLEQQQTTQLLYDFIIPQKNILSRHTYKNTSSSSSHVV